MPTPPEALALREATVRFGSHKALDRISLAIPEGGQVALIGPSGSGKTTALRLFAAMRSPTSGTVSIHDEDPAQLGPKPLRLLRARSALIPQDLGLVPNIRVIQNVVQGRIGTRNLMGTLRDLGFPSKTTVLRAHAILDRVGIGEKLYQRTDTLSGGQQQRVALARALFANPAVILADEPISSVDPARARDTIRLLTELCAEENLTLVMSLHHVALAKEFFPRIVGLRAGQIAFDAAPEKVDPDEFEGLFDLSDDELMVDA